MLSWQNRMSKVKECKACGQGFDEDNNAVGKAVPTTKCVGGVHDGPIERIGKIIVLCFCSLYISVIIFDDFLQLFYQIYASSFVLHVMASLLGAGNAGVNLSLDIIGYIIILSFFLDFFFNTFLFLFIGDDLFLFLFLSFILIYISISMCDHHLFVHLFLLLFVPIIFHDLLNYLHHQNLCI